MKLLLADDHTLFRDALAQYIERAQPDAKVSLAKDLQGAISVLEECPQHDLVILDLKMPGMNGLRGLGEVRRRFPDVPVTIMSGVAEPEDVNQAISIGAAGYFPKTLSGKELLKGIQSVLMGEKFIPTEKDSGRVMPSYFSGNDAGEGGEKSDGTGLTPRELEVLQYVARGDSNKEIANDLGIQVVTVKLHVRGICRKLGVKNRTQVAIKARELGLVT